MARTSSKSTLSFFPTGNAPLKVTAMSEESPSPAPPPLPPSPLDKLNDFSDRFSPMLVKELRQGLRTHSFVVLFLILQGLLALILLTIAAANANAGGIVSQIIFFLFSVAVLVVQPLRGMSAIASEIKADTIDLMSLTRLSAWRITFGKWSSIMGQTSLILLAIIPYLILRYFFGGMQLFSELLLLGSLYLFSGVLTAITVGLSASTLALIRAVPLLGSIFLFMAAWNFCFFQFDTILNFFTPDTRNEWFGLLATYLIGTFIGYFFLELAATAIAPSAENRATRKRLVALVVIPLTFVALHTIDYRPAWAISLVLLFLVALDFFTESAEYPSVVVRPFLRFGFLGRIATRFLAPGWATGTLFHLFLVTILVLLSLALGDELRNPVDREMWAILGVLLGIIYLPNLIVMFFQKRLSNRLVSYILFSILLFGIIPLFALLRGIGDIEMVVWAFSFLPHVQPFLADFTPESTQVTMAWITAGVYITGCLAFVIKPLRQISKLESEELEFLAIEQSETA